MGSLLVGLVIGLDLAGAFAGAGRAARALRAFTAVLLIGIVVGVAYRPAFDGYDSDLWTYLLIVERVADGQDMLRLDHFLLEPPASPHVSLVWLVLGFLRRFTGRAGAGARASPRPRVGRAAVVRGLAPGGPAPARGVALARRRALLARAPRDVGGGPAGTLPEPGLRPARRHSRPRSGALAALGGGLDGSGLLRPLVRRCACAGGGRAGLGGAARRHGRSVRSRPAPGAGPRPRPFPALPSLLLRDARLATERGAPVAAGTDRGRPLPSALARQPARPRPLGSPGPRDSSVFWPRPFPDSPSPGASRAWAPPSSPCSSSRRPTSSARPPSGDG